MPTTFGASNANIVYGGNFSDGTVGGRSARSLSNQDRVDFAFVGTDLTISINSGGYTWTIDGGGTNTGSSSSFAWRVDTLATALAEGTHQVSMQMNDGNSALDANFATVTGAAPALSNPTVFGTGAINNALINTNQNFITHDGSMTAQTQAGQACYCSILNAQAYSDGGIRFRATCTDLWVFAYIYQQKYRLVVDGIDKGVQYTGAATFSWQWIRVGTGLDGTAEHEYRIIATNSSGYFCNVLSVGGTGLNLTNKLGVLPCMAFYGDSTPQGLSGTGNDSGLSWGYKLALQRKMGMRNMGFGGSTVHDFGGAGATGTQSGEHRAPDVTSIAANINELWIMYGVNDAAQNGGAETAAQYQTSYQNMLTTLVGGLTPGTPIYAMHMLDSSAANAVTNRPAFVSGQLTAILQATTGRCPVYPIDTSGWIVPSVDTGDGTHPSGAGYDKVVARCQQSLFRIHRGLIGRQGGRRRRPRGAIKFITA